MSYRRASCSPSSLIKWNVVWNSWTKCQNFTLSSFSKHIMRQYPFLSWLYWSRINFYLRKYWAIKPASDIAWSMLEIYFLCEGPRLSITNYNWVVRLRMPRIECFLIPKYKFPYEIANWHHYCHLSLMTTIFLGRNRGLTKKLSAILAA